MIDTDNILNELENTNLILLGKIEEELDADKPDYLKILLLKLKQYENISKYYSINMRFKEMQNVQKTCNEIVELIYKIDKNILQLNTSTDDIRRLDEILGDVASGKKYILNDDDKITEVEDVE